MLTELIEFMEDKKLVSIYTYNNPNNFSLGYIDMMDKDCVCLKTLSNDGISLGYEIIKISDIARIDIDSIYDKKIQFLTNNFKGTYKEVVLNCDNYIEDSVMIGLLQASMKQNIVISLKIIEDINDNIVGIVRKVLNKTITVLSLDDYGQELENTVVYIDDILSIECGEKNLQIIQYLRENHFKA